MCFLVCLSVLLENTQIFFICVCMCVCVCGRVGMGWCTAFMVSSNTLLSVNTALFNDLFVFFSILVLV